MKHSAIVMRIVASFMLVTLTGCLSLERPYPDKKFYLFEVERETAADAPANPDVILQVRPFIISPRYEGQEFMYRIGEMRYESDFYNQFFLPPSSLLTEATIHWIGGSGIFGAVFGATAPVRPTHFISAAITKLYGDYVDGGARGNIEVQVLLTREDASQPVIIFQHDYSVSIEATERGADGLMAAWNEGLREILGKLEADLRSVDYSVPAIAD